MNIHKKVILLSTITLLAYNTYNLTFWGDDNFTQEIMQDFYNLQQKINNSMNRMFHDVQVSTTNLQRQLDQKNCNTTSHCKNVQYYEQSSSSMSFANNEKAIRIATEKNNTITTYTIDVTDKIQQQNNSKNNDALVNLEELVEYVKKHFSGNQVIKNLHECINILQHEQKNKIVSFNESKEAYHTQYVITIQDKKENSENKPTQEEHDVEENEDDGYEDKLDSRKKKNVNRFKKSKKINQSNLPSQE